jgi:hypothetical protein
MFYVKVVEISEKQCKDQNFDIPTHPPENAAYSHCSDTNILWEQVCGFFEKKAYGNGNGNTFNDMFST